jgi:hypothetical protein
MTTVTNISYKTARESLRLIGLDEMGGVRRELVRDILVAMTPSSSHWQQVSMVTDLGSSKGYA